MKNWLRNSIVLVLMLATSALAVSMRPTQKIADLGPKVDLETLVPRNFAGWTEVKSSTAQIVDPGTQEMLDQIYSQMVSRTYINPNGYRIMLSLAYGGDQSRDMQVHRPEVCYSAQGFRVGDQKKTGLSVESRSLPVMQLVATVGTRIEPITYWIRVGDKLARGNIELGLSRVSYGIRGQIADGLLVRVSSIDGDLPHAYLQQEQFIKDLIGAIPAGDRKALIGKL